MAASRAALAFGVAVSLSTAPLSIPLANAMQELSVPSRAPTETVLFTADRVYRTDEASPIIAEGNVEAQFGEQQLLADVVTYDPDLDIVTARGNVSVFDGQGGQTFYADDVELTGDLADGVATNFKALLGERTRLTGSSVVRRSTGLNDLNNAAFTPCAVCTDKGNPKRPTWAVKAFRVTQDKNDQVIRFRNALVEVMGVPVLYTPYFQFPDPEVKRKSGFLTPRFGTSSRVGFEAELPYYWAISDYQDATFSPRVFTELGTLVKGEYRVRRHNSGAVIQAGFIDAGNLPDDEQAAIDAGRFEVPNTRWHLFAGAFYDLPNEWRASVDLDMASDQTYLRTYDIQPDGELRETLDILQPDRLENQISFTQRKDNKFTDISALIFQTLRQNEDRGFMANALPRIRHERRFDVDGAGGELTFGGDFLHLNRNDGLDTTRLSASATYEKSYITGNGQRFRSFAQLRADSYHYNDANLGIQACNVDDPNFATCRLALPRDAVDEDGNFTTARLLPTAGVEWSYPLAKFTQNATFVIEPRIQAVVSPTEDYRDDVYNEDSQFFLFDTATLFDWNKATGLDLWEDGQRLNIGLAGSAVFNNGLTIKGEIGQQFRADTSDSFIANSGLGDTASDVVGRLDIDFGRYLRMTNNFRIDNENGALRRGESTLNGRIGPVATALDYIRVAAPTIANEERVDEFLTARASVDITDRWTIGGNWREDLEAGETTQQSVFVAYRDDCTIFSLDYRFDNVAGEAFGANRSLTFNIDIYGF